MQLTPYDKDDLRRSVPGPAVANSLGISVSEYGLAVCPFHDDHAPSLSFYTDDDGVQRWGCFPCGVGGDIFDLVQRIKHCGFTDAIKYVWRLSGTVPSAPPPTPKQIDQDGLDQLVAAAQQNAESSAGYMCVAASLSVEPDDDYDELLRGLGWGVEEDATVVIPHYDLTGKIRGAKFRGPDSRKWAYPGSEFPDLYNFYNSVAGHEHSVLVTEGETDLAHALYQRVPLLDVVSLPTGANRMLPRWVKDVSRRWATVYLGFDGDDAGLQATRRWTTALSEEGSSSVYVLQVPSGEDLRSCGIGVEGLMQGSYRVV